MIFLGRHGYISCGRNKRFSRNSKKFKSLVKNQIGKKIKVLRTDNGGELCGK
jgi:hypothetical protein